MNPLSVMMELSFMTRLLKKNIPSDGREEMSKMSVFRGLKKRWINVTRLNHVSGVV